MTMYGIVYVTPLFCTHRWW